LRLAEIAAEGLDAEPSELAKHATRGEVAARAARDALHAELSEPASAGDPKRADEHTVASMRSSTPDTRIMIMPSYPDSSVLIRTSREQKRG
jgi:hypothetical protein